MYFSVDSLAVKSNITVGFCSFSGMKNEKLTWFSAFSPKASKSRCDQAGLLTYPLLSSFPPQSDRNSGKLQQSYTGITAAGTVQESPDHPVHLFPF